MIMVLVIYIILVLVSVKLYLNMNKHDIESVLENKELDQYTECLPNKIGICNEILKELGVIDVKVRLNENKASTTSFYNVFSKEIVLCDNEKISKSFARILFIAHECIHASQKQAQLKFNFILANINVIFTVISVVLIWCNIIQEQLYLTILGISLILNIFSFFARNAIESSATYMSVIQARRFLKKYIEDKNVDKIDKEYERVIHNGYTTFAFSLFTTNILLIALLIVSILACTYIY